MRTRGMHHISLKVAEDCYQATVGFYRDLLELKVVRIQDTATFLSSGNVTIEILKSAINSLLHFWVFGKANFAYL